MNTLEDRVRAALRVRAEDFSADPDALARIRTRAQAARRRRGGPRSPSVGRFLIPTAAAAAVVAIVAAVTVTVNGISGRPTGGAGRQHPILEPNHVGITPGGRPVRVAHAVPAAGTGLPDRDRATAVHLQGGGELFLARRQQPGLLA